MNENKEAGDQNIFSKTFEKVFGYYETATFAVITQDLQTCEEILPLAKSIFKNAETKLCQDENIILCNYVNLIEVGIHSLRANLLLNDERLDMSLDELNAAKQICDDAQTNFRLLSAEAENNFNRHGDISVNRCMFSYFEKITIVFRGVVKKFLDMREGKFINQVKMFRKAAADLKKEDYSEYFGENDINNKKISALIRMLNAMADSFEKKAERLEEKMKAIEFMPPIDKKVFIVHGHNVSALEELKLLLLDKFKIKPIVLWEEEDNGMTVIEKFERYGRLCAFAFVLVTPDDWVTVKDSTYFQARPNVLFELGWFAGRYGRNKVRVILQKKTPLPSDLGGLITQEFDEKISEISGKIKADLINAGILDDTRQIETV